MLSKFVFKGTVFSKICVGGAMEFRKNVFSESNRKFVIERYEYHDYYDSRIQYIVDILKIEHSA